MSKRSLKNTPKTGVDYHPFGMTMSGRSWTQNDSYRFGFNGMENDDEIKGDGNSYDFGARMYDPRVGRWLSLDPDAVIYPGYSPYNYVRNSPIFRIDPNGRWDVEIHVFDDREKHGYGIALVKNNAGEVIYSFYVRAEGTGGRNRLDNNADSPTGTYNITGWLPEGNPEGQSNADKRAYGRNPRTSLDGVSGEIMDGDPLRMWIRIHGGRQELFINNEWVPYFSEKSLCKTHGCFRAFDEDMEEFYGIIQDLEANDPEEAPGQLIVTNDLSVAANSPNDASLLEQGVPNKSERRISPSVLTVNIVNTQETPLTLRFHPVGKSRYLGESNVITSIPKGEEVISWNQTVGNFTLVSYNGRRGWVSSQYLKQKQNEENPPTISVSPSPGGN